MNFLILVATTVVAFHAGEPAGANRVQEKWIEQRLDHFDQNENATWLMRYFVNSEYLKKGGPIFIYVGGAWTIDGEDLLDGHLHDMAKEHNGSLYYIEHRYYGESYPTRDLSTANLKYLNARQALEDLAHFIRNRMATVPELAGSKVILMGCSYSAALVIWFKRLHPELVTGCWASCPAVHPKLDFYEYREITGESFKLVGGEVCYAKIKNGFAELETIVKNRGHEIPSLLGICDTFNASNKMDVWYLFSEMYDLFGHVVQHHNNIWIQHICNKTLSGDDALKGLTTLIRKFLEQEPCEDMSYKAVLAKLTNTSLNNGNLRQWIYQNCNDYILMPSTSTDNQPFGKNAPLEGYIEHCANLFDNQFNQETIERKVAEISELFGGLSPNVTDVYMTQGQLDPLRALGIQDPNKVDIIPMASHCQDVWSISEDDSSELRRSKEKIAELVRKWVQM